MKQVARRLFAVFGYLVYTVCIIVVLLWVLFPADSAMAWLRGKLHHVYPSLTWSIASVEKKFPLQLRLSNIRVLEKNDTGNPLFHIDEIYLSPEMKKLTGLQKQVPVQFLVKTFGGTVRGDFLVPGNGEKVQCTGEMRSIQLDKFAEIWKKTDRTGSGELSGTFQFSGLWQDPVPGVLQASLKITDGSISLKQPIFGLEQLDFHTMTTDVTLNNRVVSLDKGVLDSRMLSAGYTGNINIADNLYTSALIIRGFMEPRPELFGGLHNAVAATLIKSQLQDGKLSFTISGTLIEPGITFTGASGVIDGVIEGGGR